jgi:hypothetical protein
LKGADVTQAEELKSSTEAAVARSHGSGHLARLVAHIRQMTSEDSGAYAGGLALAVAVIWLTWPLWLFSVAPLSASWAIRLWRVRRHPESRALAQAQSLCSTLGVVTGLLVAAHFVIIVWDWYYYESGLP